MSIKFKKINEGFKDLEAAQDIYIEAFPELNEIPFSVFFEFEKNGDGFIQAAYDKGKLIGYIAYLKCVKIILIENFAVLKEVRGKGYGSKILTSFMDIYRKKNPNVEFFLDVEEPVEDAPNLEQRKKRIAFYERLGFKMTHIKDSFMGIVYITMTTMWPQDKEKLDKIKIQVNKIYKKYQLLN